MTILHVPVAANALRPLRDHDRRVMAVRGQLGRYPPDHRFIVRDQPPLASPLPAAPERIGPASPQDLAVRQQAEQRQHPRAEGLLALFTGARIAPREQRRGEVELEPVAVLELRLELAAE